MFPLSFPSMILTEAGKRDDGLICKLTEVWEASVRATHGFLSEAEICRLSEYVPEALRSVSILIAAEDDEGNPCAFMGIEDGKLEMLFIAPSERGMGLGRRLLTYGIERYGVRRLAVNEQNPQAEGFYEHMGFHVCGRSDHDEQGNPYPVLYMSL